MREEINFPGYVRIARIRRRIKAWGLLNGATVRNLFVTEEHKEIRVGLFNIGMINSREKFFFRTKRSNHGRVRVYRSRHQ